MESVGWNMSEAESVKVRRFHEILVWPLRLLAPPVEGAETPEAKVAALVKRITASKTWKRTGGVFDLKTGVDEKTKYAEFVYFYPFIRDILYGKSLAVLARYDVTGVTVEWTRNGVKPSKKLDVKRVNLYVTHLEVALLVVEVAGPTQGSELSLDDVMDIQDRLRRAYAPYWGEDGRWAGHCPDRVQWLGGGNPMESDYAFVKDKDGNPSNAQMKFVVSERRAPVAAHWKWLMSPMLPETAAKRGDGIYYQQLLDERMPAMCYVAVDEPKAVKPGDQVRLCFLDGSGTWEYPYARDFLKPFEAKYCYDRYWQVDKEYMTSRLFCCGYAFTVLGRYGDEFFSDGKNGLLAHFRHHYLHLGLIALLQHSILLVFSKRLSEALEERERFNAHVERIQKDVAEFVSGIWFFAVTNQVQGQELFRAWSDHLNNQKIFDEVMLEVKTVSDILLTSLQEKRNDTSLMLTRVATIVLPLSLAFSFWGIDGQAFGKIFPTWLSASPCTFWITIGIAALLALTIVFHKKIHEYARDEQDKRQ